MKIKFQITLLSALLMTTLQLSAQAPLPIDLNDGWEMTWNDEFDYPDSQLEEKWISQNNRTGGNIVISSRWRDNVEVKDGLLYLKARKETRAGQNWTTGSIWTKRMFHYGYMECRYKYAEASGLNNAFWTWNSYKSEYPYELDINEGHYPNIINTNYHDRCDTLGKGFKGASQSITYRLNGTCEQQPYYTHTIDSKIKATKVRLKSKSVYPLLIGELRIFAPNKAGYPSKNVRSDKAESEVAGLINLARAEGTTITSCGYNHKRKGSSVAENIADGKITSMWASNAIVDKWVELSFDKPQQIGCIQLTSGWNFNGKWKTIIDDYEIEFYDGKKWHKMIDFNQAGDADFANEFHTYGMLWGEDELTYYFDGKPLRTIKYKDLHNPVWSPTKIYLSLAVLNDAIGGIVTDAIDGTSMKVDYVRYYEKK